MLNALLGRRRARRSTDRGDGDAENSEESSASERGSQEYQEEDTGLISLTRYLRGRQSTRAGMLRVIEQSQRVDDYKQPPLKHELAAQLNAHTAALQPNCFDSPEDKEFVNVGKGSPKVMSAVDMLRRRECNWGGCGHFSPTQKSHMASFHYLPNRPTKCLDRMHSRAYIGQFNAQGTMFVAGFQQDKRVRIYDVENNWRVRKDVNARGLRWTITDTCLSHDSKFLIYASITPVVHLVNVGSSFDCVESIANITEIHEELNLDQGQGGRHFDSFGVWSIRWAANRGELVAGAGESVLIFDMESGRTLFQVRAHQDDTNAVAYLDDSANLIVSGSDDSLIKVWDRRTMQTHKPVGVMVGHTEGLTHLDPKGDGRYFISNCKDQTIKLWDVRSMMSEHEFDNLPPEPRVPSFHWDYRWMDYPARDYVIKHPHDLSLMTYRGHYLLQTLIRAYFSPMHTTGQRFIYCGSHDGAVYVYDVVTGERVERLRYHREIVRDCSWHPYEPMLVTTSFDGAVVKWDTRESPAPDEELKGKPSALRRLQSRRRSDLADSMSDDL